MRISTQQLFNRITGSMTSLVAQGDKLQTQIATTKKFTQASEDPVAYQRVQRLNVADADDTAYGGNVKVAQGLLQQTESTIGSMETQLMRAKELALQAGNGTLSTSDKATVAASLEGIITDLMKLANTTDSRGTPIFAGAQGTVAFERQPDGTIAYTGVGDPQNIPISATDTVQTQENGERVLGNITKSDGTQTNVFNVLQSIADALRNTDPTVDTASILDEGLTDLSTGLENVTVTRSSVGARQFRMDFEADRLTDTTLTRKETRSGLQDTDMTTAIAELQKTMTVLSATQASFSKLSQLTLFDYLK